MKAQSPRAGKKTAVGDIFFSGFPQPLIKITGYRKNRGVWEKSRGMLKNRGVSVKNHGVL